MGLFGTGLEQSPGSIEGDGNEDYSDLISKIARAVAVRQLSVPAIVFLESVKPLSFLGNQMLVFLNPMVSLLVSSGDYYKFVRMIEDRENVEKLIEAIEDENARFEEQRRSRRESRRGRSLFGRLFRRRSRTDNAVKGDGGGQQGDHQDTGD